MPGFSSAALSAMTAVVTSLAASPGKELAWRGTLERGVLEPARQVATGVEEASDVAALPDGRFVVVGDRSATARIVAFGQHSAALRLDPLPTGDSQLEAVAYAPASRRLVVLREEEREAWRYAWDPGAGADPRLEGVAALPSGGPRNKGPEGLAALDPAWSPTRKPQWIVVKEAKPQALWLFDEGLEARADVHLPEALLSALTDFSGVAVDPLSGHVVVASQESASCARLRLERRGPRLEAVLVQVLSLVDERGAPLSRVEGITFDVQGRLYVVTEKDGLLRELRERRPSLREGQGPPPHLELRPPDL